jgi:hypothetical protein
MADNDQNDNLEVDYEAGHTKRSRRHRHRSSSRHWIISPLWIVVILQSLGLAALAVWGASLQQDNDAHVAKERMLNQSLIDGRKELEAVKGEYFEYKHDAQKLCMPHLVRLKLDEIIPIDKEYVKSAIFMVSGKQDQKTLEYKFVLKNTKSDAINPQFELIFLNAKGNQIGVAKIGRDKRVALASDILEKDEVRTVNGAFELLDGVMPESIMLKFKEEKVEE